MEEKRQNEMEVVKEKKKEDEKKVKEKGWRHLTLSHSFFTTKNS